VGMTTTTEKPGLSRLMKSWLIASFAVVFAILFSGTAMAEEVPEPISVLKSIESDGVGESAFLIDYLAVTWKAEDAAIDAVELESDTVEPYGAVRFRHDGTWGGWVVFVEDGAEAPGEWGSALVSAERAEAYEIRGIPAWAMSPNVFIINTTDGKPMAATGQLEGASGTASNCLSRAEWGADESLRLKDDGTVSWPADFYPVQGLVVHHAGSNDKPDPAEIARAIYVFHTVGRGWGDIAYNYLVDKTGQIYEGRWSGSTSTRCSAGGDGSDFAHNAAGDLVRGGHTKYHNEGNAGVALLGNYATPAENRDPSWVQAYPTTAMMDSLESLLADLAVRHGRDPTGEFAYVNPMCELPEDDWRWDCSDTSLGYTPGVVRFIISGHRNWRPTACPGSMAYTLLPGVRNAVVALIAAMPAPVDGTVTDLWGYPIPGATVSTDTGEITTAALDGSYRFDAVAPGDRHVEAAASGFVTSGKDISLSYAGATADLTLALLIERLSGPDRYATSVAISAASFAPGVPVVYVAVGTG
jgi:hypothetical protein